MKCSELRDMIKKAFSEQGKKLSNLNKMKKTDLLQIIEKYNISPIEWKIELEQEEEENKIEKQKEEENKLKRAEAKKIEEQKSELIRKLLYKKWFNEYMKKNNKNVIEAYYELIYESEINDYDCKKNKIDAESLFDSLKTAKIIMNKVGGDRSKDKYKVIHNTVSLECSTGMCPNVMFDTSMCKHFRNDLTKPVKYPVWRRRDIIVKF